MGICKVTRYKRRDSLESDFLLRYISTDQNTRRAHAGNRSMAANRVITRRKDIPPGFVFYAGPSTFLATGQYHAGDSTLLTASFV